MTDPDRGAYTPPTDAPLAFDARRPVRGGQPVPMTLIISAIILAVLVAAIFLFYRGGVRGANDAPQVVGAPVGEITAAAPAEEQPADPAAGLQIYQQGETGAAEPTFAPPPEQPLARPEPALPAPKAAPTQPVVVKTAPVKPVPAQPVAKAATPAPKASGGSYAVQVGAFSSAALADKGWSDAAAVSPGSAAGKGKQVEAIERDGKTLYRTAVTGFSSRADATAFCDALKGAGKTCFVR